MNEEYVKILCLTLIAGFLGWCMERLVFYPKTPCDRNLKKIFGICPPFLLIYSAGILILYLINKYTNYSLLTKALLATILITFMECIAGVVSQYIYGYRTWKYRILSMCNGYISITSGVWFMLSLLILSILNRV